MALLRPPLTLDFSGLPAVPRTGSRAAAGKLEVDLLSRETGWRAAAASFWLLTPFYVSDSFLPQSCGLAHWPEPCLCAQPGPLGEVTWQAVRGGG